MNDAARQGQVATAIPRIDREDLGKGLARIWQESSVVDPASGLAFVLQSASGAWKNMRTSPVTALLSTVTIGIALTLFSLFLLAAGNIGQVIASGSGRVSVTVFFRDGTAADRIEKVRELLSREEGVDRVTLTDQAQALRDFRSSLGDLGGVLDGLEERNPLPASLDASVGGMSSERVEELLRKLRAEADVEEVQYSRGIVERLTELARLVKWAGWFAVIVVLAITGFIISNTIGLALYSHRTEIEIMRLVGATPRRIQLPYLIEGGVQGIIAASAALLVTAGAYLFAARWLRMTDLAQLVVSQLHPLSALEILTVLGVGVGVGIGGSAAALRRFMREER